MSLFGLLGRLFGVPPRSESSSAQSCLEISTGDTFATALRQATSSAGLDFDLVAHHVESLRAAHFTGSPRDLGKALRELLPPEPWDWPDFYAWSAYLGKKPTRLRMVAAVADLIESRTQALERREQLLQNVDRRPWWQVRSDTSPWPEERAQHGRIKRWNSDYWQQHGALAPARVGSQFSIRAYTNEERRQLRSK